MGDLAHGNRLSSIFRRVFLMDFRWQFAFLGASIYDERENRGSPS
jgi:hypothetical protein